MCVYTVTYTYKHILFSVFTHCQYTKFHNTKLTTYKSPKATQKYAQATGKTLSIICSIRKSIQAARASQALTVSWAPCCGGTSR